MVRAWHSGLDEGAELRLDLPLVKTAQLAKIAQFLEIRYQESVAVEDAVVDLAWTKRLRQKNTMRPIKRHHVQNVQTTRDLGTKYYTDFVFGLSGKPNKVLSNSLPEVAENNRAAQELVEAAIAMGMDDLQRLLIGHIVVQLKSKDRLSDAAALLTGVVDRSLDEEPIDVAALVAEFPWAEESVTVPTNKVSAPAR
jgi:hypothetical protein